MQLASPDAPAPAPQAQTAAAAVQAGPQQGASTQQRQQPSQPRQSSNRFKAADEQPQQEQVEVQDWHEKTPEQLLVDQGGTPTVDVLADKTAGLLQELSQKGNPPRRLPLQQRDGIMRQVGLLAFPPTVIMN